LGGIQAVSGDGMVFRPHLSFAIQDGPPQWSKPKINLIWIHNLLKMS
jgi:hypothetical protein